MTVPVSDYGPPMPIIICVEEYNLYDKIRYHNTTVNLTTESGTDILNIYPEAPPDVMVGTNTYDSSSFSILNFAECGANVIGSTLTITPNQNVYSAGVGIGLNLNQFYNTKPMPQIIVGGQTFRPNQVQTLSFDSSFTHAHSGTQLTLTGGWRGRN